MHKFYLGIYAYKFIKGINMLYTVGTPFLWFFSLSIIFVFLLIDIILHYFYNFDYVIIKQSIFWSIIWFLLALFFNFILWYYLKFFISLPEANSKSISFFVCYLIEKFLSIDNVFVWIILFKKFNIPFYLQRKVLIFGVFGAIFLRFLMIFSGLWLINKFIWLFYLFGFFLIFTGIEIINSNESKDTKFNVVLLNFLKKYFRITSNLNGKNFFIFINKKIYFTPLMLVLILVELSDIFFALDSVPSIFSITTDSFIVFISNLFAVMGLRSMFFLLSNKLTQKFYNLQYVLSLILIFIGLKMILHSFISISVFFSLFFIICILLIFFLINFFYKNI